MPFRGHNGCTMEEIRSEHIFPMYSPKGSKVLANPNRDNRHDMSTPNTARYQSGHRLLIINSAGSLIPFQVTNARATIGNP